MAGGESAPAGAKRSPPRAVPSDDYFVFPHIAWMILIPFGFVVLFLATFSPSTGLTILPWPFSDINNYMGTNHRHICISLCVFALVAHCVEAAYAGKVCQDKNLTVGATAKWTFMTFLFGFASLIRLNGYKGRKSDKEQVQRTAKS